MDDNLTITSGTNLSRPILPIDTLLINPEIRQILRPVLCPFIRQNERGIIKMPPHIFANHLPELPPLTHVDNFVDLQLPHRPPIPDEVGLERPAGRTILLRQAIADIFRPSVWDLRI